MNSEKHSMNHTDTLCTCLRANRHLESFEPDTAYIDKFSLFDSFMQHDVRCVVA